jgi:hypothetical protein
MVDLLPARQACTANAAFLHNVQAMDGELLNRGA